MPPSVMARLALTLTATFHRANESSFEPPPVPVGDLTKMGIPPLGDVEAWATLQATFARSYNSIEGFCNRAQHPRQCLYTHRLLFCTTGARLGEANPSMSMHPDLTVYCGSPRVCHLFRTRGNIDSKLARAHLYWCRVPGFSRRLNARTKTEQHAGPLAPMGDGRSFLTFEACGGLTNQRIALVHGLMIAYLTRSKVILPSLNPNGVHPAPTHKPARGAPTGLLPRP